MHGRRNTGTKVCDKYPLKYRLSFAFQNAGSMSQMLPYGSLVIIYLSRSERAKEYTMKMDETVYRELFTELEDYEQKGIDISIDGYRASPLQIVTAYMMKEEGTYMRDYVLSREGNIEALIFTDINVHQAGNTP